MGWDSYITNGDSNRDRNDVLGSWLESTRDNFGERGLDSDFAPIPHPANRTDTIEICQKATITPGFPSADKLSNQSIPPITLGQQMQGAVVNGLLITTLISMATVSKYLQGQITRNELSQQLTISTFQSFGGSLSSTTVNIISPFVPTPVTAVAKISAALYGAHLGSAWGEKIAKYFFPPPPPATLGNLRNVFSAH